MWFHVVNRGADRQDIFHDDADHLTFESLLADAVDRFGIEIHAWCQMTNHFHGLVHCPDDVLPETFHRICSIYAGRYNRRYARTGPLFENRYKSKPVIDDSQLLQTSRYIHRNPEPIVGPRALAAYRWSSLGVYLGSRPAPDWLTTGFLLDQFANDPAKYRAFVEHGPPCDEVAVMFDAGANTPSIDDIVEAVAAAADVDVTALYRSRPPIANWPRLAAILLIIERRVSTAPEVAEHFAMGSATTARTAARRARVQRAADESFRQLVERAADRLR